MLQSVALTSKNVDDYRPVVGDETIDRVRALAAPLRGMRVLHVNATAFGGGVAELLASLVPLMRSVGIDAEWQVIAGAPEFWQTSKAMHNLLQGASIAVSPSGRPTFHRRARIHSRDDSVPLPGPISVPWTDAMATTWKNYSAMNASRFQGRYDAVVAHDPQPAGILHYLLETRPEQVTGPWIWRCHIDLTTANSRIWNFLRPFLAPYQASIFTMQEFVREGLTIPMVALIPPSIDPLSPKNRAMAEDERLDVLRRFCIDPNRPIISQVSRFDPWKDPIGVIDVYRLVKERVPGVQLLMVGSMALDDPEGTLYFERTARHAAEDPDIHLLSNLTGVGDVEVNAFQRSSSVVIQKSIREGFGLVVAEALWKERPVVAGNVGGIALQVASGMTGYLISSTADCAQRTIELLENPDLAIQMGQAGRERVRANYLIIRLLEDYLQLIRLVSSRQQKPEARAVGHG